MGRNMAAIRQAAAIASIPFEMPDMNKVVDGMIMAILLKSRP